MMVRVKICGITNLDDALCAAADGADMLGFIFAAQSPRVVTPFQARTIIADLRSEYAPAGIKPPKLIGVFVNETVEAVTETMETAGLDYAQLHGAESAETLARLSPRAYKAVRPRPGDRQDSQADYAQYASLGVPEGPRLLVDTYSPHAYGGTGELSDWAMARRMACGVEGFMLAGGLTPDNVAKAVMAVRPWAVDTSSGVERTPGRKDHDALKRFISNAKAVVV